MDFVLVEDRIGQAYSTIELSDILRHHLLPFIRLYPEPFVLQKLDIAALSRVSIPRKQLVRALAVPVSEPEVMREWTARFSAAARQALQLVAWEGSMSDPELAKRIGVSVLEPGGAGATGSKRLKSGFPLLQHSVFKSFWGADGNTDFIELPPLVASVVRQACPEAGRLQVGDAGAPPAGTTVFRDEENVLKVMPFLSRFIRQGELRMTQQGEPSARSLVRIRDASGLAEFYDRKQPSELSCLRVRMLLDVLRDIEGLAESSSAFGYLREVIAAYLVPRRFPHGWFFYYVRGMVHCRSQLGSDLHLRYWKVLENLPTGGWITVEAILRQARLLSLDLAPLGLRCADRYLYVTSEWRGWGNKKRYLTPGVYRDALQVPLLKAFLYLYASLGLLDIACRPLAGSSPTGDSAVLTVFDGLASVRLTDLGAVMTGRRDGSPEGRGPEPLQYELDPDHLFITCNRADPIADISLQRFARKIASRRYRVDAASFLQACADEGALRLKISSFRQETSCSVPPLWDRFFEELLERAEVVRPVDDLLVFRLVTDNPTGLSSIYSDRELRCLVLKAEGGYLLVKKSDVAKLKKRLAELGYLM